MFTLKYFYQRFYCIYNKAFSFKSEKLKTKRWQNACAKHASSALYSRIMARILKQTTNITGLEVCPNPKGVLNRLYKLTVELLDKMPDSSAYKKYTKEIIFQRSAVINSTDDVSEMEKKLGCGQIEEVIVQAKHELELARSFTWMRPWEKLITPAPKNMWEWPVK